MLGRRENTAVGLLASQEQCGSSHGVPPGLPDPSTSKRSLPSYSSVTQGDAGVVLRRRLKDLREKAMAVPTGIGENRVLAAVLDTDITEVIQCQLLNEVTIERPLLVPIQRGRLRGLAPHHPVAWQQGGRLHPNPEQSVCTADRASATLPTCPHSPSFQTTAVPTGNELKM